MKGIEIREVEEGYTTSKVYEDDEFLIRQPGHSRE